MVLQFYDDPMIHILPTHERAVIYTLGRLTGVKGPGLVIVIPGLQRMTRVDMRSATIELPNATVTYRVSDPAKALSEVADFRSAVTTLAESTLKRVLAGRSKDALVFERRGIEEEILKSMNAVAASWGIHLDKVELKQAK
jgi:regulator of protease activity HflC (stomatin/prohibitin superfamily)